MAPSAVPRNVMDVADKALETVPLSCRKNSAAHSSETLFDKAGKLLSGTTEQQDSAYNIVEEPIGTRRPIRVACMGAGYSGLMMGIVFSERMKGKNAELVIYERNQDLGGTWLENR